MNYQNNINTYANLTAYNADNTKDYPNVSYIQATDEVKMYEYDPEYVVCKYNVTSTESATTLLYNSNGLNKMYIDGVQQQSVVTSYQFSTTGEHIVKYGLTNTTRFSYGGNQFNDVTALTEISIPNTVTIIGNTVFMNCSGLTKVKWSENCTSIGNNIFNGCTSLTTFIILNSVTSIGNYAFYDCSGLTSVTIGSGVTSIGSSCFRFSSNLSSVTVLATTPPILGDSTVFNNTNNYPIYVPYTSVNAYKAASGWSYYASRIQAIPTT